MTIYIERVTAVIARRKENNPQDQQFVTSDQVIEVLTPILNRLTAIENAIDNPRPVNTAIFNGHDYVDLGLYDYNGNATYFATCNVGATSPEEMGDYYKWGITTPYAQNGGEEVRNGNYDSNYEPWEKVNWYLIPADDVANVKWGGNWRLPDDDVLNWIENYCTVIPAVQNNVTGWKIQGPNGNSIFLPSAGYYNENGEFKADKTYYWTSMNYADERWKGIDLEDPSESYIYYYKTGESALAMLLESSSIYSSQGNRIWGLPIRPVCKE